MDHIALGVLAHVDAGKTTLCEALLYRAGELRTLGRVDHGDAFLDTDAMERQRGITIFSKQALFDCGPHHIALLDTPGHVDFSSEMERTLSVLDSAILVIAAGDGVSGYTQTLWRLLARYHVPTMIFINKMDVPGADRDRMMAALKRRFGDGCVDAGALSVPESATSASAMAALSHAQAPVVAPPSMLEDIATLDERAMNEYLADGMLGAERLRSMIASRALFPCYFGSALRLDGVDELLEGLRVWLRQPEYPDRFGARVFNIAHDENGNRMTWLKVTGGQLAVKTVLDDGSAIREVDRSEGRIADHADHLDHAAGPPELDADRSIASAAPTGEKVDQIRLYSGAKYTLVDRAEAGMICALTGPDNTVPGQGLGIESDAPRPALEPVLTSMLIPGPADLHEALTDLRLLQDEDPMLRVRWLPRLQEVHLQLMGEVQLEVVRQQMHDRFGLDVDFGPGDVMLRETIDAPVEGVGHFEPLRHYAEVHLLLEPLPRGAGLKFDSACSEDVLDRNWQRLILTHLREREHLGVLTGSPITDMRITLLTGRGHLKHTEGGDFREATYRAVRQGLMKATSRLLEPWYRFGMEVPQETLGHAMSDVQRMGGHAQPPEFDGEMAMLTGEAPVSSMRGYAMDMSSYTHGRGQLSCTSAGYRDCHNAQEIIDTGGYDPVKDLENTPDSVFCAHGAGYAVAWNRVEDFMHVDSAYKP